MSEVKFKSHATKAADPVPDTASKRSIGRVFFRATVYFLSMTAIIFAGLLLWLMDRPVEAPAWVQARIEAHLERNAPNLGIEFGAMVLTVQTGWRPMLELRDVRFDDTQGTELLAVSDLQATLAMRPLLEGRVQPSTVSMSGLFATVQRGRDGQVSVVVSPDGASGARRAATLPALINQIDELFLVPELAALRSLDVSSVTLRIEDARAARAWTIDGARLRVMRDASNLTMSADLALLSGGAGVATMAANFSSPIGQTEAEFGVTVQDVDSRDIAAFNPAFGWLNAIRAPMSGSLRSGMDEDGTLRPINATLQIEEGVLQPTGDTAPIPFKSARTYFSFDPAINELQFDELSVVSAWGAGRAEGRAMLSGLDTGRLEALVGQVRISDLTIDPPDVYDAPIALDGAQMDFRLIPQPFQFDLGQLRIVDQGNAMRVGGALKATPDGWDLSLDARMAKVLPARLLELWPEAAIPRTRQWIADNVLSGELQDVELAVRSVPGSKPDSYLGFAFDNATVRYMKTFPPIEQGRGVASLLRNRFALSLSKGIVEAPQGGVLDVAGSSFVIPDVTVQGGAPAIVDLRTSGTATATLSVLDLEPLGVMGQASLSPALATGSADVRTEIRLPLRPNLPQGAVKFDGTATVRDVTTTTLVAGRTLRAPELSVQATNAGDAPGVTISGAGTFDGIGFDATWRQALGPNAARGSRVDGSVEFSAKAAKVLALGLPDDLISGTGRGQLTLDLDRGAAPKFAFSSQMRGIGLSVPSLGWRKPRNTAGTLEVSGRLGARPAVDRISLSAPGLSANGTISLRENGGLDAARFARVRVGGWLDAPVVLSGRGAAAAPAISVRGGSLDLRQANFAGASGTSGNGARNAAGPITLALDRLVITDTIALTDMRADFDMDGGLSGRFLGKVNGGASVTGEVLPQNGRSAFRISSDNAGAVFASAGFLKQARGGDMTMTLSPVGTAGAFNGALTVENTRIKDAPAIAALFNALSVVGLLEQMGGQGLHFQQVEAAFRLTPERVTLTQASAVGPSIGLSMDGTYDVNSAQMDMQGVFSPIYLINGIGSLLTRKGEGLIGFNFRLTGPAAGPKVQVNPLSALTPSIFREIFRRPPPEVAREPGAPAGTTPRVPTNDGARQRSRDLDEINSSNR